MRHLSHGVVVVVCLAGVAVSGETATAQEPPRRQVVTAEQVARMPYPGTVVPGSIAFTPDGKALSYLLPEAADSNSRVLWRLEDPAAGPRVVARPPGGGDTDTNISREEALRRERQRQRATGITQVASAEDADLTVIPLQGDLYLQRGAEPLERLTETPQPELDPRPSADGTKIAFVRDGELHVITLEGRSELRLTEGATEGLTHGLAEFIAQEELDRQTGYWWSPDGSRLAYQQTDERHIPAYTIAHQGDAEFSLETHRYPFAGAENARVRLGVVSASGGPTSWLPLGEPDEPLYLARVTWEDPEHLLVQTVSRDQKRLRLQRIAVADGTRTTLIEESSPTWLDLHDDLHVVRPEGSLVWSTQSSGTKRLVLLDRDGKLLRDLTPPEIAVDAVAHVDGEQREVWFLGAGEGPLQSHLYRVSLDGGALKRLTTEPGMHAAVVAPDGSRFVDTVSDRARPARTTLRDRDGQALATIHDAAADPRVAQLDLAPPELLSFPNRDGVTLHGAYYAARSDRLGTPAPLIVMVYGGPTVQTVTESWGMTADLTAQYYARLGFAVWKCDNRGSARRDRAFQAPVYRKLGEVEVADQVDGVRFLARHAAGKVDPARVGITGGSYGGYMTLRAMALAPETFHAGVAAAPVTFWEGYDTAYTERYMGTPADNPEGYGESSVLAHAAKITGRLLLIHGMIDENVHFRHSARLIAELVKSGRTLEVLPLPGERHGTRAPEARRYVAERSAAFFENALGRAPQ